MATDDDQIDQSEIDAVREALYSMGLGTLNGEMVPADDYALAAIQAVREHERKQQPLGVAISDFNEARDFKLITSLESPAEMADLAKDRVSEEAFLAYTSDVGVARDGEGGLLIGKVNRQPYNDDDLWFAVPAWVDANEWGFEDVQTESGQRIRTLVPWDLDDPRHLEALQDLAQGKSPEAAILREHPGLDLGREASADPRSRQEQWDQARIDAESKHARSTEAMHRTLFPEDYDDDVVDIDRHDHHEPDGSTPHQHDKDIEAFREDLELLDHTIEQWNPHNPKQAEKIDRFTLASKVFNAFADQAQEGLDNDQPFDVLEIYEVHERLEDTLVKAGARPAPQEPRSEQLREYMKQIRSKHYSESWDRFDQQMDV